MSPGRRRATSTGPADTAFADGAGRDLLVETARYWASRVRRDSDGRAHIDGVIGPDEYHELVDDNAFTNVMARWNLRRASAVANVAEVERAAWLAVADALVDGYEPTTRVYEQFRGFADLEPILISEVAPRRPIAADLLLGAERTAQAQVIKQPDVLMLHHLVPDEVAPDSLSANLDFYEPRTAHGSSLSPAVHAALLARDRPIRAGAAVGCGSPPGSIWTISPAALPAACTWRRWVDSGRPSCTASPAYGWARTGSWSTPDCLHSGTDCTSDFVFGACHFDWTSATEHVEIDTDALELEHVDGHWEVTSR